MSHIKLLQLGAMALLQALDLVSTWLVTAGAAVELNPLLGSHPRVASLALFKLASVGLFALLLWRTKNARLGWLCCALFSAIVFSNLTCLAGE